MAKIAEGLVWQYTIPAREFDELVNKQLIIHHLRDGENIRMRVISREKPSEDAQQVHPYLEDAYLCLLKDLV
jgi:hypothetical protein